MERHICLLQKQYMATLYDIRVGKAGNRIKCVVIRCLSEPTPKAQVGEFKREYGLRIGKSVVLILDTNKRPNYTCTRMQI